MYIRPLDNGNILQKSLLPNISDTLTLQMQTTGRSFYGMHILSLRSPLLILDPTEKGVPTTILVLLCAQFNNGKYTPAQRDLIIGCALVTSGPKKVRE